MQRVNTVSNDQDFECKQTLFLKPESSQRSLSYVSPAGEETIKPHNIA